MMATRQDVASLAGVSVATVSYVMNDTKNVTPEVRLRVEKAIEQLNYRPNLLARGLSKKETRHVALLIDNLNNPYYSEVLSGAQAYASEMGYIVSVISVDYSGKHDVLDLASRGLDGVILVLPANNEALRAVLPKTMPVVTPDDIIMFNFRQAFDSMLDELVSLGHSEIAFLSGLQLDWDHHLRFRCWREAMLSRGLPIRESLIVEGSPCTVTDEAEGMRAMHELLSRKTPFTAVYAINDLMALGAMRALHMSGLRVPQDVSVIGCDRLKVLGSITPTLSTMNTHSFETGQQLMRMLIEEVNGRQYVPLTIDVDFVRGESIGPAGAQQARVSL